jgi:16S rRNA (guanine527-N7)-methyltransferase
MIPKQTLEISVLPSLLTQHQQAFDTLAHLLIEENKRFNLTRIIDPNQIGTRHFLDSLAALSLLDDLAHKKPALTVVDIGSGAGFPVLPLAIVRPDWKFTSIEATGKKANFQKKVIDELGLKNVIVVHGRAEELSREKQYREQFDAAVARAVAPMRTLAELSLAFVKIGGCMLAFKGRDAEKELTDAAKTIAILGGQTGKIWRYILPGTIDGFCLISISKTTPTPGKYIAL